MVVNECRYGNGVTFIFLYTEMACIRLGENAGVMDLAVRCTLQVSIVRAWMCRWV